eukprot:16452021-Heterocapsa_arctica.AAC.1
MDWWTWMFFTHRLHCGPADIYDYYLQCGPMENTAMLLQRDPGATWIDHCPVVTDCWFRTWYTSHLSSDNKPWDLPRMTHDLRNLCVTTATAARIDRWAASEQ